MKISATSYSKWTTCQRLWYYDQLLRIERARQEGPAAFGKLFHAGLETWWRTMDGGDMPWREADAALVDASKSVHEAALHVDTDVFDVAKAEAMLFAYHARYFELEFRSADGHPDGGVERAFDLPLLDEGGREVSDWRIVGRQDAIKRFADGRVKPTEHKTSGSSINPGAPYWDRVKVDTQVSIYVDAARRLGWPEVREALYDVSRRPDLRPLRATPEERRRYTKGKGCPHCGGRKGGKLGVAQGTGTIRQMTKVDGDGRLLPKPLEVTVTCESCKGTGWHEAPHLDGNQRENSETVVEYRGRVAAELQQDPDAYFRMASIPRSDDQLMEMRADLVVTTGVIGALVQRAHAVSNGNLHAPEARRCFPRNTRACLSVYGTRCPYLDLCTGAITSAAQSPLYRIRLPSKEVPT